MSNARVLSTLPSAGVTFRNKIINGDMTISQRYGTSASANTIDGYFLDRWQVAQSTTGKLIAQQNAGSVTPPVGFSNYLGVTSQSSYTLLSTDNYNINQFIEGFNSADLGFGTANAKPVTISFWVRSSLTGTFGGVLMNGAGNRSYPFTYTISLANTWEQKTFTVAGDTGGTWVGATNGIGLRIFFGLGVGSTYSGTAGAWAGALYVSATGATSVVGTSGATFYITGVQLEKGSVATPYEVLPYQVQLAQCQRYYTVKTGYSAIIGSRYGSGLVYGSYSLPVQMRATPTVANASGWYVISSSGGETSSGSSISTQLNYVGANVDVVINTTFNPAVYVYTVVSGASGNNITFSAEL